MEIAEANRQAAEASRIAEQERVARLRLEAALADRVITPSQHASLVAAFGKQKGQTADLTIIGDTPEIANISSVIAECMNQAGMLLNFSHPLGGPSARGVLIGVRKGAPAVVTETAQQVVSILRETLGNGAGLWDFEKLAFNSPSTGGSDKGAAPPRTSPLRIVIGSK